MRKGFTLLELLVATAIVAVASVVVLGGFAAGIRVWERAREFSGPRASARITIALVRKDLCNMTPCRAASFEGAGTWLEFPAVVTGEGSNSWPGTIRYEFSQGVVKRMSKLLGGGGGGKETGEVLLADVRDVSFSYGDAGDDGQGGVVWVGEWIGRTNLPVAVTMAVRFREGQEQGEVKQTVLLPRGYPVKEERGNAERR
jgi:prepilin-type N-terminal cleavage/methylation domain-containing protein